MTTIILTATVNVNPKKIFCFQKESKDRINTYLKSVLQWLTKTNFNIILVENSGYNFYELDNEKEIYKNRFEVITFMENELLIAKYLENNIYKGASEVFSINYAFNHSNIIKSSNFIIKITGRFFINELQEYLSEFNLDDYDCLTQQNRDRCEMVGSHYKNFDDIFNIYLNEDEILHNGHIEYTWKSRTSKYKNILICKELKIEPTLRGGVNQYYDSI
jgi:hypothetical protein